VSLCRECPLRNGEFIAKDVDLIVFGFEEVLVLVGEDKIQQEKAGANELGRVTPAIAQIFAIWR